MPAKLFRIGLNDVGKGLMVAVFAAVFTQLASALNTPGFDFATFDWIGLFKIAMASCVGYLAKNFLTDSQGNILGSADRKKG